MNLQATQPHVYQQAMELANPCYITSNPLPRNHHYWKPGVTMMVVDNDERHMNLNVRAARFIMAGTHHLSTDEEIRQYHADQDRRQKEMIQIERNRLQKVAIDKDPELTPELEERLMAKLMARMALSKKHKDTAEVEK